MIAARLTLAALLLLIGSAAMPANAAPKRGGELVYARFADSLFLDPVINDSNADIWILTNLYDTLLEPSADGKGLTPGLAQSWTLSDDKLTMTLMLRPGIEFSDGTPIAASDVKFSLDRARDPKAGQWGFLLEAITEIETPASNQVVLHLGRPDPTLPAALATFNTGIMPERAFMASPGKTMAEKADAFAKHPIGSGPFMLTDWHQNVVMHLARNPHYWADGEDGKKLPYLDGIRFEIIPDDATRILKLQGGEIDGAEMIPLARVGELASDPAINMVLFPSTKVDYLTFMVRPSLKDGTPNPLSDTRVRQALNYALDKDAFIQVVGFGHGKATESYMSSVTPFAVLNGPLYPYDPDKAKSLLAAAGYEKGFHLSILVRAGGADDVAVASVAQQMWGEIGVDLSLELVDAATLTARYRAGDFQLRTGAWTDDIADPNEITSYFAYSPNIECQHSGFEDKEINAEFEASQHETDPAKRAQLFRDIQARYIAAAPIAFLFESPYAVALSNSVKGFVQIPLGNNMFAATYLER